MYDILNQVQLNEVNYSLYMSSVINWDFLLFWFILVIVFLIGFFYLEIVCSVFWCSSYISEVVIVFQDVGVFVFVQVLKVNGDVVVLILNFISNFFIKYGQV